MWKNFPTCDARYFSKSEAAAMHMCKQTKAFSLAIQPTYSESVTFVANYCRNTRNICATNVWRRNMCRAVFEISGNNSKSQELTIFIKENYAISHRMLETWAGIKKTFQLFWCWLHFLHQYGYHTIVTITCTVWVSKLCINVHRHVNCEILCTLSKSSKN